MNNKLVGSLLANLANGAVRSVGQAVAGAVVAGVLGAMGIDTDDNDSTSDSQNDSDSNSDSVDGNTEA